MSSKWSNKFFMPPQFAEQVGVLFTSGNSALACQLVNAFINANAGTWSDTPYRERHTLNRADFSAHSAGQGRIFQPHCQHQANAVLRDKAKSRELV